MEHESFVPGMTTARMVQALRTPDVVRASLPGWQPDAGAASGGGAEGRLRLRVGGSTITYRGTVTVSGEGPGFTVAAVGTEVRGGAGVTANAEVTVVTAVQPEAGVTVVWRGEARAEGRLTTYEPAAVEAAVRRLLDRFCAELAAHAPAADGPQDVPEGVREDVPEDDAAEDAAEDAVEPARDDAGGEPEPDVVDDLGEPAPPADELDDFELVEVEVEVPESAAALDDLVPPAEAAHARRTMIGRSAEEVDHAPPRGRYAPVPAPDSSSAAATLRWAAPVAAALVASAVVVGRVLRRRG
jgi:carbon monoxide dehydrogenase subunit G